MQPGNFEYHIANSIEEAESFCKEKADASFLAGGHSLIPAMKLRLAEPGALVDIAGLDDLKGINKDGDTLNIGALTTHAEVENSDMVKNVCPVLADAAGMIGDPQVRNRGTIGGNIAHADPASDYPGILIALKATIVTTKRSIGIDEFFTGLFETALNDGELIKEIQVPLLHGNSGAAYAKFFNPASRYAVVGVGVVITMDNGACSSCSIGVTGASSHAFRASTAEEALTGSGLGDDSITAVSEKIADGQEMLSDLSASADYRAHLCGVIAKRAIANTISRIG